MSPASLGYDISVLLAAACVQLDVCLLFCCNRVCVVRLREHEYERAILACQTSILCFMWCMMMFIVICSIMDGVIKNEARSMDEGNATGHCLI